MLLTIATCSDYLDKGSLGALEACCRALSVEELDIPWAIECRRLWGATNEKGSFDWWKDALHWLEDWARALLKMDDFSGGWLDKLLSSAEGRGLVTDRASALFALTRRKPFRRSVAAYATQDLIRYHATQQRLREVKALCWRYSDILAGATDVEDALRSVLRFFPFLPARSAHGADRVIDELSKVYAEMRQDTPRSQVFDSVFDGAVDAANATYILWYSIALLNTDLHNPRVSSKITEDGFARSLAGTILGSRDVDTIARALYRSVKARPLLTGDGSDPLRLTVRREHFPRPPSSVPSSFNSRRRHLLINGGDPSVFSRVLDTAFLPHVLEYVSWATILATVLYFLQS